MTKHAFLLATRARHHRHGGPLPHALPACPERRSRATATRDPASPGGPARATGTLRAGIALRSCIDAAGNHTPEAAGGCHRTRSQFGSSNVAAAHCGPHAPFIGLAWCCTWPKWQSDLCHHRSIRGFLDAAVTALRYWREPFRRPAFPPRCSTRAHSRADGAASARCCRGGQRARHEHEHNEHFRRSHAARGGARRRHVRADDEQRAWGGAGWCCL